MNQEIARIQTENFVRQVWQLTDVQRPGPLVTVDGSQQELDVVARYGPNKVIVFRCRHMGAAELLQWKQLPHLFEAEMQADFHRFMAAREYYAGQGLTDIPTYMFTAKDWDSEVGQAIGEWYKSRGQTINLVRAQ